jgi:hypothetical protein
MFERAPHRTKQLLTGDGIQLWPLCSSSTGSAQSTNTNLVQIPCCSTYSITAMRTELLPVEDAGANMVYSIRPPPWTRSRRQGLSLVAAISTSSEPRADAVPVPIARHAARATTRRICTRHHTHRPVSGAHHPTQRGVDGPVEPSLRDTQPHLQLPPVSSV